MSVFTCVCGPVWLLAAAAQGRAQCSRAEARMPGSRVSLWLSCLWLCPRTSRHSVWLRSESWALVRFSYQVGQDWPGQALQVPMDRRSWGTPWDPLWGPSGSVSEVQAMSQCHCHDPDPLTVLGSQETEHREMQKGGAVGSASDSESWWRGPDGPGKLWVFEINP